MQGPVVAQAFRAQSWPWSRPCRRSRFACRDARSTLRDTRRVYCICTTRCPERGTEATEQGAAPACRCSHCVYQGACRALGWLTRLRWIQGDEAAINKLRQQRAAAGPQYTVPKGSTLHNAPRTQYASLQRCKRCRRPDASHDVQVELFSAAHRQQQQVRGAARARPGPRCE